MWEAVADEAAEALRVVLAGLPEPEDDDYGDDESRPGFVWYRVADTLDAVRALPDDTARLINRARLATTAGAG